MNRFQIREAKKSDACQIFNFISQLAEFEKLSHEVKVQVADLEHTLFGENPRAHVLIGEWDGTPVAFALYFFNYSTFLGRPGIYLEDLFVLPSHRGKSFGRQMLAALAGVAEQKDCGRFEWSVLDWNAGAIRFYQSLGARPQTEWTTFRLDGEALKNLAAEDLKND